MSGGWQRLLLIAAAARLEEPDILVLDEPTNHLDLANINTLERWLTVEFRADADREPRPRILEPRDRAHAVPAQRRHACLQDPLSARPARSCCAATPPRPRQARLEDKEIRRLEQAAARYKVWAVKNPDLNKRKNAVETRIARIEKERTRPTWRASGGWN